jgi:hypothetical protein
MVPDMGKVGGVLRKLGRGFKVVASFASDLSKGMATGAAIGSMVPGIGSAVGAVAGATVVVVRRLKAGGEVHRDPADAPGEVRLVATGPAIVRTLTALGRRAKGLPRDVSYCHRDAPDLGAQCAPIVGPGAYHLSEWYAGRRTLDGAVVLLVCRLLDDTDVRDPLVTSAIHGLRSRAGEAFKRRALWVE